MLLYIKDQDDSLEKYFELAWKYLCFDDQAKGNQSSTKALLATYSSDMGKYIDQAKNVTEGARRRDYDRPLPNFLRIALLDNVWYAGDMMPGRYITPLDVDITNILQKIAREQNTHKDDNIVDIVGYADLLDDMDQQMKQLGYTKGVECLYAMDVGEMFELLLKAGPNAEMYIKYFKEQEDEQRTKEDQRVDRGTDGALRTSGRKERGGTQSSNRSSSL
jgi:hypothetical protein